MKRTDITNLFPEASKEQVDALMDIHSADIQKHKDSLAAAQNELTSVQEQLGQLQDDSGALEAALARAEKAEKDLADMQGAEATRLMREKVAGEKNIPAALLTGETEETCAQQADAILAFAKPGSYPAVKDGGSPTKAAQQMSTGKQFAEWAEKNF